MEHNDQKMPNLIEMLQNAKEINSSTQDTQKTLNANAEVVAPSQEELLGIIINNSELNKDLKKPPAANDIEPETLSAINEYMKEMDQLIEKVKEEQPLVQEQQTVQQNNETVEKDYEKEESKEIDEAIVLIDKLGVGSIINFTPEEREKLERAKKIKIEEVETVNVKSFKTKRSKKNSLDKILKRHPVLHSTPIVLPASGYTAVVKGCSTYELISLMSTSDNALVDAETKWSLIHSKLESTSLGNLNFNDFLKATAAVDYNMFIYAILCATYPDNDKIPLQCPNDKCRKEFDFEYSVRSLLRGEKITDKLKTLVARAVEGSHTEFMAKQAHNEAPVNQVKAIKLPISGIVMEVYVQSAYDLIYNSIKSLQDNKEEKYNQAAILSTTVKTAYIPDPDSDPNDPEYFEFTDAMEITKIIFSLTDKDILVLTKQGELMLEDLSFEFGLVDVKCPHCGHYREEVPFDIESILFYRYQQAMSTNVE